MLKIRRAYCANDTLSSEPLLAERGDAGGSVLAVDLHGCSYLGGRGDGICDGVAGADG